MPEVGAALVFHPHALAARGPGFFHFISCPMERLARPDQREPLPFKEDRVYTAALRIEGAGMRIKMHTGAVEDLSETAV